VNAGFTLMRAPRCRFGGALDPARHIVREVRESAAPGLEAELARIRAQRRANLERLIEARTGKRPEVTP
jgi:hypothetical protein